MKKVLLNQFTRKLHVGVLGAALLGSGICPVFVSATPAPGATSYMARGLRINVTGVVKDAKGEPLPGVSVKLKGSNAGTTTDVNGVYHINVPEGEQSLIFSFVGYVRREVKVSGRTNIAVTMQESTSDLDEVVVMGYGTQKKSQLQEP